MRQVLVFLACFFALAASEPLKMALRGRFPSVDELRASAQARSQKGRAGDDIFAGYHLYANVSVGTPPQEFEVVLCFATTHFVLVDERCKRDEVISKNKYDLEKSRTGRLLGSTAISFGCSGVNGAGRNVSDTVHIGDNRLANVEFLSADVIVNFPERQRSAGKFIGDGMMCLGSPNQQYYKYGENEILKRLESKLSKPRYTIWLGAEQSPGKNAIHGQLTWADHDSEHCQDDFLTIPLVPYKHETLYFAEISTVQIGGAYVRHTQSWASFEVQSPTVHLPKSMFEYVTRKLRARYVYSVGMYVVDCEDAHGTDIAIEMNGYDFAFTTRSYVLDVGLDNHRCVLGLEPSTEYTWKLGVPFLQTYCYAYDFKENIVTLSSPKN